MAIKASNYSILVVDDEEIMRNGLCEPLAAMGYDVSGVASAEAALKYLEDKTPGIIITDLRLPGMSGMDLLTRILEKKPHTAVLVMTAYGSVETAVDAMKKGAFDYITKPFSFDEIQVMIEKMSEKLDLLIENEKLRTELKGKYRLDNIIGKSSKMQAMYELIEKVSSSGATVIIYGESGTGKELTASAIHYSGQRAGKPYIKLNCAALPESLLESELFGYEKGAFTGALTKKAGKFESAEGGTIFLDEIGDIVPEIQVKLLRVLQEKEFMRVGGVTPIKVDVRIICATNANLLEKVKVGKFREDLYYRLNVIPIYI
nr:sigma-54 dependent transcriptional regulator [Candidatus Wallbacteria bacterium]